MLYGHDHGKMTEDRIYWREVLLYLALLLMTCCNHAQEAEACPSNDTVPTQEDNEDCFLESFEFSSCPPGYHKLVDGRLSAIDIKERRGADCYFCPENSYQPVQNECPSCIACTNCTARGRKEIQACNITHNAVCGKIIVVSTTDSSGITPAVETTTVTGITTQGTQKGQTSTSSVESPHETERCSCVKTVVITSLSTFVVTAIVFFLATSFRVWIWQNVVKKFLGFLTSPRQGGRYSPANN